ncbi:MAG: CDP-glycerol glycerophosphotransferase family protein [Desulfovibrio sp.]|nr:CDP-glycerol glycerophosphotransferase family protein [Desulfovibrio sp.]
MAQGIIWELNAVESDSLPYAQIAAQLPTQIFTQAEMRTAAKRLAALDQPIVRLCGLRPTWQPFFFEAVHYLAKQQIQLELLTDIAWKADWFTHLLSHCAPHTFTLHAVICIPEIPGDLLGLLEVLAEAQQDCTISLTAKDKQSNDLQALYQALQGAQKRLPFTLTACQDHELSYGELALCPLGYGWRAKKDPIYRLHGVHFGKSKLFANQAAEESDQPELIDNTRPPAQVHYLSQSPFLRLAEQLSDPKQRYLLGIRLSGLLDRDWYTSHYPDVARSGLDPIVHYVESGAGEGRNPNAWFDTAWYVKTYPDVIDLGLNPFYHFLYFGHAEGRTAHEPNLASQALIIKAEAARKNAFWDLAFNLYSEALAQAETTPPLAWILAQADIRMQQKDFAGAEEVYRQALERSSDDADLWDKLAICLASQWKWLQVIEARNKAVELTPQVAWRWYELGRTYAHMRWWGRAALAYEKAVELDSSHSDWHYHLALVREETHQPLLAQRAYDWAVATDTTGEAKRLGVGIFHARHKAWQRAQEAFEKRLPNCLCPELYAELANACLHCFDFAGFVSAACEILRLTCASQSKHHSMRAKAFWQMALGLEKQGKYALAAKAYQCALAYGSTSGQIYRQGFCLYRNGDFAEACQVFLTLEPWLFGQGAQETLAQTSADTSERPKDRAEEESACTQRQEPDNCPQDQSDCLLPINQALEESLLQATDQCSAQYLAQCLEEKSSAFLFLQYGLHCEQTGQYEKAAQAYGQTAERLSNHEPKIWFLLGRALARAKRFEEACSAFASIELLREPYALTSERFKTDPKFRRRVVYLEFCRHLPVKPKTILYESLLGNAIGDSPGALFQSLLADQAYEDWTHVWALDNLQNVPEAYANRPNVIFILRESDGYLRWLATASILINDVTFPDYFARRQEQKYLNTWHGSPLKTLGRDIVQTPLAYGNATRNFLHATHRIHPNAFTRGILNDRYGLHGVSPEVNLVCGYPRVDLSLNLAQVEKEALRLRLGVPAGKKLALYAPTWRGKAVTKDAIEQSFDLVEEVLDVCGRLPEICLVLRLHHGLERYAQTTLPEAILATQDFSANALLSVTDILITDYSSIAIDFLALKRPIVFFCPDQESYEAERGLYIKPEDLGGFHCKNPQELAKALRMALDGKSKGKRLAAARETYCGHDDGKASERVWNFLLTGRPRRELPKNGKKNILFYCDFRKNGIGQTAVSFINALGASCNFFITCNLQDEATLSALQKINAPYNYLPIANTPLMTLDEDYLYRQYHNDGLLTGPVEEMLSTVARREFYKHFADLDFDIIIDFCGYSGYIIELFAFAGGGAKKFVWMHNDMVGELKTRHPWLRRLFPHYVHFDRCVSVSETCCAINREKLEAGFGLSQERIVCLKNFQDAQWYRSCSNEDLCDEDLRYFAGEGPVYITVGRLSPEKNQALLIEAFARVRQKQASARLLILGQGPLEDTLKEQISKANLQEAVFLLGFRDNPYPWIKRADCFVLPSLYEGQPTVLFEAMALNVPIIATDIPQSREVLQDGKYGQLVAANATDLSQAMLAYAEQKSAPFGFEQYNAAIQQEAEKLFGL